jgi:hypothetical protein
LDVWVRYVNHRNIHTQPNSEYIASILRAEIEDPDFGGLPVMASYLSTLDDVDLLFSYAAEILTRDPQLGLTVRILHIVLALGYKRLEFFLLFLFNSSS